MYVCGVPGTGPEVGRSSSQKRRCAGECKNQLLPMKVNLSFLLEPVLVSHCLIPSNLNDAEDMSKSWSTSHGVASTWLRLQRS